VGTVMSRLFRGRKLLQKTLKEYAQGTGVLRQDEAADGAAVAATAPAGTPTDLEEYRRRKKVG
jgi:RNA polymerase sigma-70 factor (ECF subfamily)